METSDQGLRNTIFKLNFKLLTDIKPDIGSSTSLNCQKIEDHWLIQNQWGTANDMHLSLR